MAGFEPVMFLYCVFRDTYDCGAEFRKFCHRVAKALRFRRAAGRVVLGIEI